MIDRFLQASDMLLVAAPLLGAAVLFAAGARARAMIVFAVLAVTALGAAGVIGRVVTSGAYVHTLGGWGAPLGIVWRVDGLASVMILLNTLVGTAVSIYSLSYFRGGNGDGHDTAKHFWPLWFMLWGGLYALFLSHDIFNWYVTLELSGLAAVALITLTGETAALRGAMRYLLLALFASLLYLAGVAVLYAAYGVLDVDSLRHAVTTGRYVSLAMALMIGGLVIKSALFPLHFWLPSAHASAPSPVSAALSALVVKGGFYIILRLITDLFPHALTHALSYGLGALGAAAVLWGSYHALRMERLKLLVAYSTVAQIGYLFMVFPLMAGGWWIGGDWASRAWCGGVYQALSHGLAKASLFLAAGVIIHARGHDRMDGLKGLGERLPMTATAMALAGISLMAIPPGAGFIAKWMMLTVSVYIGQWPLAVVMILGGLGAVGYLFRIYRRLMSADTGEAFHRPPRIMEAVCLALALLSILFGLSSMPVLNLLAEGGTADLIMFIKGTVP